MRILLLETLHPDAEALLRDAAEVVLAHEPNGADPLRHVRDADAVLTRGRGRIDAALLAAGPCLQAVARCGTGLDNVDVDGATARGIPVVHAPGASSSTLAEHTLMLMLAAARDLPRLERAVAHGDWEAREGFLGRELAGATLGVVGLGATGRRVAQLATAFGMRVVYWSRSARDAGYRYAELDELLATADVVSLHLALSDATRGLIDARRLALMKPGALLVNTARGALVDEHAVARALTGSRLGRYAADVLAAEPPGADSPLPGHPHTVITPHTGGLTNVAYREMCVTTSQNVLRILAGEAPEERSVANGPALAARRG